MNLNIVVDSGCDLRSIENLPEGITFSYVPLSIIIGENEFVDDEHLDIKDMVDKLYSYKGKTSTACPSPEAWYNEFLKGDETFAVTITSGLSGSYNSAMLAKKMLAESHPEKKAYVLDSLSAGPEMTLITEKAIELALSGLSFEELCAEAEEYKKRRTHIIFVLKSLENLAKNGRVSKAVAKVAGMLNIYAIGIATGEGTIKLINQCRGMSKAYSKVAEEIKQLGFENGKIIISHCLNEPAVEMLKKLFAEAFGAVKIDVMPASALCTYYAEKGGVLIGFEA